MNDPERKSHHRKLTRNVIVLGIVSLFTDAATEMIYPLVPVFITLLGSNVIILGVIEGAAETTAALLKLVSGVLSDKIRKRKLLIVIGYGISTVIRPFTGIVSAAWQIIFIRMGDRVGKGIRTAPRDALIAASVDDRTRGKAYGFHRAMDHTGAVIGPVLAILVLIILILGFHIHDTLSALRYTFILAIIPGLFSVIALIFFVQEKIESVSPVKKQNIPVKQFDKNFFAYLSVILLFTLGNSSDAFLLFRVQDAIHHNDKIYSAIFSVPVIGNMVSQFGDTDAQKMLIDFLFLPLTWAFFHIIKALFSTHLGALSDRIGRKRVITIGWSIYAVVYLSFALLDRIPDNLQIIVTFILFAVYALYYASCEGAEKALVADIVKPEVRGSAFGLYNFAVGLGALPASIIFGVLYKYLGAGIAFGTGASLACISMMLLAMFVNERHTE